MTTRWVVAAMVVLGGLLAGCGQEKVPGRVVRIVQDTADRDDILAIPYGWAGLAHTGQDVAWLAPGAFVGGDAGSVIYQRADSDSLRLAFRGGVTSINGSAVSAEAEDDSAVAWLEQASPAELGGMRLFATSDKLSREIVLRMSAANPTVGLFLEHQSEMTDVLPLFRPRWLVLGEHIDSIAWLSGSQRSVEILWTFATDSGSLAAMRALPRLRELILSHWEPPYAGLLPARLEALLLYDGQLNAQTVEGLNRLRTLVLSGSTWSGPLAFPHLKRLQWFGFPKNTTQAEFAAVILAHPKLEVVELLEMNDSIDLAPLGDLRRLRAVTLDGAFTNFDVLKTIPTLEFVGLSDDMWSEVSTEVSAIQAALPAAVVVEVTTLCLGSGWILLIFPIALLAMLTAPRRRVARSYG